MNQNVYTMLYRWYLKNGRHDLPWRQTNDPYQIYISEIMLQQTQVKTVLERFYFPFLKKFPTLQSLADADEDAVVKAWEGLGYYTRARNLHKAAKQSAPQLPQSVHELEMLTGIGRSTAHAIAAFAYHTPVPILDANVKRILYRLFAKKKASEKELWEMAYKAFDHEHPYDYNQAMMDLGSMVCQSKTVLCDQCPFETVCLGKVAPLKYPAKKVKKKIPIRQKHIVIHQYNGKVALKQRKTRFLHNLWGFHELDEKPSFSVKKVGEIVHIYSHFRLEATVYLSDEVVEGFEWFAQSAIDALALSGADHKALALLQ
jgi:A/G-specific adenine glycosylase